MSMTDREIQTLSNLGHEDAAEEIQLLRAEINRLQSCLRHEQHRAERIGTHGPGYARGRAEAGLVLQTNIGGGSCRHGVRLPHECAACADEASDADVAAWMARTALAGEVKP